MIHFLYADALRDHPVLGAAMFRDRKAQFIDRHGWDLETTDGQERDSYDAENPLYVIWRNPDGGHGGSMRFLPTTGPTMVNDHFLAVTGGPITSPLIWECTRFCLPAKGSGGIRHAVGLMAASAALGRSMGLSHAVAIFDDCMARIYRRRGWPPEVIGSGTTREGPIHVGLWDFAAAPLERLAADAGLTIDGIEAALHRDLA